MYPGCYLILWQLDTDFAVLAGRVGRARQEPLGLDRDWREYYLLGGPAEGQQPTAELGVLWVRARAARASSACPAETWRGVSSPEQLQAASRPPCPPLCLPPLPPFLPSRP